MDRAHFLNKNPYNRPQGEARQEAFGSAGWAQEQEMLT